jgi:hypothetical protein
VAEDIDMATATANMEEDSAVPKVAIEVATSVIRQELLVEGTIKDG